MRDTDTVFSKNQRLITGLCLVLLFSSLAVIRDQLVPFNADRQRRSVLLTGDEPEYLLAAISVAEDGDMNLWNNLREQSWLRFQDRLVAGPAHGSLAYFKRVSPAMSHAQAEQWGNRNLLVHRPGTSMLISLAGFSKHRIRWWSYFLMSSFALTGIAVILISSIRAGVAPLPAVTLVSAMSLCPPGVYYMNQAFPDIPIAILLTTCLALLLRPSSMAVVLASVCVSLAPWFSDRVIPACCCTGMACLLIARNRSTRIAVGAILATSVLFLAMYYFRRFHVPYPMCHSPRHTAALANIPGGFVRVLMDRGRGIFWVCPVLILTPVAFLKWWRSKEHRILWWSNMLSIVLTLIGLASFPDWRGGVCPACRYGVLLQWLAIPPLLVWTKIGLSKLQRVMVGLPLLYGATQTLLLYNHPNWWYREYNPIFAYPSIQPLYRFLPDLTDLTVRSVGTTVAWSCLFALYAFISADTTLVRRLLHRWQTEGGPRGPGAV